MNAGITATAMECKPEKAGDMRQQNRNLAFRLSLSSLMAALGAAVMLSSSLIPVLTYVAPMLASLTLIPVLREFGSKTAWMTWGVTALLALLLCADREAAFFYLFIGWYPMLKPGLDRIPSKLLRVLAKLLLFTVIFTALFLLLTFMMGLEDMKSEMLLSIAVYGMLTVTMLLFDRVYGSMTVIYDRRLRDKLIRKTPKT